MLPFGRFLLNTLFITVLAMAAELLTTSLVAFGFARFQFRGGTPSSSSCSAP